MAPGEPGYDELSAPGKPQALVVVPTRELAVQVAGDLAMAAAGRRVRIVQVYGGRAYEPQVEALGRGALVMRMTVPPWLRNSRSAAQASGKASRPL